MKKVIRQITVMALAVVMIPQLALAQSARPIEVFINGMDATEPDNPEPPIIREDRTYLPLRAVAEDMGLEVDWNEKDRSVAVKGDDMSVTMTIGEKAYDKAGESVAMDVAPFIEKNRTYVPMRFLAEGLDINVQWDEANRIAIVGSYFDKTDFDGAERVKSAGYSYLLPKAYKDRLVIESEKGIETFYDKANAITDDEGFSYGRIGEIQHFDDPVKIPVPMILLEKTDKDYLVFTFSSDVQVRDIDNEDLVKSYQDSKQAVQEILKTVELDK
ncbi:MAG: copper amine oxidase N-terminal domain-containing protein [Peptoniphilus sp.]|nr:copper amine oxidase N-terminal domain-containing protein [Peptoniphilus sp.]MDD7363470.1 copper amine oxidase N-terminal domain-containing protein [Bacillota bacterium]MDY6044826.1 copper amine oxidase N-terminal domain-containing protein [Peptoniphilus sp.]